MNLLTQSPTVYNFSLFFKDIENFMLESGVDDLDEKITTLRELQDFFQKTK